jgi:hypothetical protein
MGPGWMAERSACCYHGLRLSPWGNSSASPKSCTIPTRLQRLCLRPFRRRCVEYTHSAGSSALAEVCSIAFDTSARTYDGFGCGALKQLCVATASFLQHRPADPRSGSDGALFSEAHRAWRMLRPSTLQRTPWTSCDPFKRSRRDLLTSVPGVTCSVQVSVPTAAAVDESLH